MPDEDRINQMVSQGLPLWEPEQRLAPVSQDEVRFSRGFLSCDPVRLLDGFSERWTPFLFSLNADFSLTRCYARLGHSSDLSFQAAIAIDEEIGTIGFDGETLDALVAVVLEAPNQVSASIVAEYFARRCITSLHRCLLLDPVPTIQFISQSPKRMNPPVASLVLEFTLGGRACFAEIGLGVRAVERLDAAWRTLVTRQTMTRGVQYSDQLHTVSIELAELAVPPAVLIDYVRAGTVIDLESAISAQVSLRLDEVPWCHAELLSYRGCFAVRVAAPDVHPQPVEDGMSRVRIELARFQLDHEGVLEHQQSGAILATRVPLASSAQLLIGGEQVASASIHELSGRFAITILPR